MADSKPTLFQKLRESELRSERVQGGIRHAPWLRLVIIAATVLVCMLSFPLVTEYKFSVAVGSEWSRDTIKAERAFTIFKPEDQYQAELQQARDSTRPVFTIREDVPERAHRFLDAFQQPFLFTPELSADTLEQISVLSRSAIDRLMELTLAERRDVLNRVARKLNEFHNRIYDSGLIDRETGEIATRQIAIQVNAVTEKLEFTSSLIDFTEYGRRMEKLNSELSPIEQMVANDLTPQLMRPNLIYSPEITRQNRYFAEQSVLKSTGIVDAGEVIVAPGQVVTHDILARLTAMTAREGERSYWQILLGNLVHVLLIFSMLLLFLNRIRPRIFSDNYQFLGLCCCLILISVLARISVVEFSQVPAEFLIVVPACSMLVAILYDSRTAFYTTITMTLLLAGTRGNDYETALVVLIGSTYAAYTVRDLRSRTQVFKAMASIFIGYGLAITAIGMQHSTPLSLILEKMAYATINAIFSPVLTLGLLFVIERIFNIASDLRLLEFDNQNHPLLVQLADRAPGTYQHTRTVAHLAESAARAVDANPILARVGTYFHDIGKLAKSEYFVENQIGINNKHDRLTPQKSANIIKDHVKAGMEMAREHRLPRRILEFIPMHHGTMLIKHFYAKAVEEAQAKGQTVNEENFRYPGPLPNSKETGIVMLADTVEALSRTLDGSREELSRAIDKIIKERLLDGQLDKSDLSLRDLNKIKDSFVRNLVGMSHQRIKYKTLPGEEDDDAPPATAAGKSAEGGKPSTSAPQTGA